MAIIQTGITINAAPGDVFALLSEHARLGELGGGTSRLLKPGILHPNGKGAVREIKVGGLRFEEEITAFEPEFSYSYQILSCTLPFTHEGGTVTVKTAAGHADVHWESTFYWPIPILGGLLDAVTVRQGAAGFLKILRAAKRELEAA
jgi:hypothetical protein